MSAATKNKIALQFDLGTVQNAKTLAQLGKQIFTDTYGAVIPPSILQPYLNCHFSSKRLIVELSNSKTHYLIAKIDSHLVGYAKLTETNPPNCLQKANSLELVNLYVDKAYHGLGVGSQLMERVLNQAKTETYQTIWLCVWKANDSAVDFYKKWGFRPIGTKNITVGTIIFNDWVMSRSLEEINDD